MLHSEPNVLHSFSIKKQTDSMNGRFETLIKNVLFLLSCTVVLHNMTTEIWNNDLRKATLNRESAK